MPKNRKIKPYNKIKVLKPSTASKCYLCHKRCIGLIDIEKDPSIKNIKIINGYIYYEVNDIVYKKPLKTLDHIIPLSKGGTNRAENLAICCYSCNHKKGNKTLDEYKRGRDGKV